MSMFDSLPYPEQGLNVEVYRRSSHGHVIDCTNGGATATHDTIRVITESAPIPECAFPVFRLVSNGNGICRLIPAESRKDLCGPMSGGNYAGSCDGRFNRLVESVCGVRFYGAIAVHDRYETYEQNEILSR